MEKFGGCDRMLVKKGFSNRKNTFSNGLVVIIKESVERIKVTMTVVLMITVSVCQAGDLIFKTGFQPEPDCTSLVYPPGLNTGQLTYPTFNDGFFFGESTNSSFLLNLTTSEYISLSDFSYPVEDSRRRIVLTSAPTNYNLMDQSTISVSECPGDFTETAACVIPVHNSTTIFITTKPTDPSTGNFCKLDHNKTYYINYILSPAPFDTAPSCNDLSDLNCAIFYSESL